jgi:predicted DNA-binding protein with PD1-like motif
MKYTQAGLGRIFILRLEDGETVHEEIEKFSRAHSIRAASVIIVGGADKGSRVITGPAKAREYPVEPVEHILKGVHEAAGVGTLFPNEKGEPILHLHMACGRESSTVTGCVRSGVKVWHVMEVILIELTDCSPVRTHDSKTGFKLLNLDQLI